MHAETVVALISAGLAAIIAVVVPWMAFRLALRQDRARWLREQRAQLYVDMLTEAHAEQEYFHYAMAADEDRERMRKYWTDLRLAPLERARLGARGTIFASRTVNRLFMQVQAKGQAIMFEPRLGADELGCPRLRRPLPVRRSGKWRVVCSETGPISFATILMSNAAAGRLGSGRYAVTVGHGQGVASGIDEGPARSGALPEKLSRGRSRPRPRSRTRTMRYRSAVSSVVRSCRSGPTGPRSSRSSRSQELSTHPASSSRARIG